MIRQGVEVLLLQISYLKQSTAYKLKETDIRSNSVTVTPFEVGAHTGHINIENKNTRPPMTPNYFAGIIKKSKNKEQTYMAIWTFF